MDTLEPCKVAPSPDVVNRCKPTKRRSAMELEASILTRMREACSLPAPHIPKHTTASVTAVTGRTALLVTYNYLMREYTGLQGTMTFGTAHAMARGGGAMGMRSVLLCAAHAEQRPEAPNFGPECQVCDSRAHGLHPMTCVRSKAPQGAVPAGGLRRAAWLQQCALIPVGTLFARHRMI